MRAALASLMLITATGCFRSLDLDSFWQGSKVNAARLDASEIEKYRRFMLGKHDAVASYLAMGGDPNITVQSDEIHGQMQSSLLSLALMHKQFSSAWLLLEYGAKPNALKGETHEFPLWWAASCGNLEITKALVKRGANLDAQLWGNGTTALHAAIYFDHPQIVRYLVDSGADVSKRTLSNNPWGIYDATPLELALKLGRPECERELTRKLQ